ncbi:MAG: Uma2 family endonuclease [Planctomycetota bacterium]
MSITEQTRRASTATEPRRRRWSAEEFHKVAGLGLFDGQRVELIDGEILEMSPHGVAHATSIALVGQVLGRLVAEGAFVRPQLPLRLGETSEPEPDFAIVPGSPRDYAAAHPTSALLVVEVSDTTLASDRTRKASLYASANIPEYWIVNLIDRQLEVFRQPIADAASPLDGRYDSFTVRKADETIRPSFRPDQEIGVKDLLP